MKMVSFNLPEKPNSFYFLMFFSLSVRKSLSKQC